MWFSTSFYVCIILVASVFAANETNEKDIDELINSIYNDNNYTTVPVTNPSNSGLPSKDDFNLQPGQGGGISGVKNCECVPYYLCENGTVNTNGIGIIDIRIDDENSCSKENYLLTCCPLDKKRDDKIIPNLPIRKKGCGYRNPDGVGFRVTGVTDEASFGEFPWMVAILREQLINQAGEEKILNVYQCGGALIHPQVVVTAAHCVIGRKNKKLKVRVGEWDTQTDKEIYPHQDLDIQDLVTHPHYYAGAYYNDIALLFLKESVKDSPHIGTLCLPPKGFVADYSSCLASGWGKDQFGKQGKYQIILKKIELPIVPRANCQQSLRKTRLGQFFELHQSFVCAGGEAGKDTCKGDGGSPLICPIPGQNDRFLNYGIVDWGIGCGEAGVPGVYVNVPLFREWIDEQMALKSFETTSYQY